MIKYIVHLKDGANTYYAGDDRRVDDRWTSNAGMATRWPTRAAATEFVTSIRAILNPRGQLNVREVQIQLPKEP